MKIIFHRTFEKRYKKTPVKVRRQFNNRLRVFEQNPSHPFLRAHQLSGKRKGLWSINITGDWRAVYIRQNNGTVIFIDIDTHSNLYG